MQLLCLQFCPPYCWVLLSIKSAIEQWSSREASFSSMQNCSGPGVTDVHSVVVDQTLKMTGKSKNAKTECVYEEIGKSLDNDCEFLPHYEVHTNKKKQNGRPQESPPSVLPPSGSHPFWPSSGEGSSMSSVDNVRLSKPNCNPLNVLIFQFVSKNMFLGDLNTTGVGQ